MAMTKDKDGNYVFIKGKEYRPRVWVNPVWPIGQTLKCADTEEYVFGMEDGTEVKVKNGKGIFTSGNDTRSYVATNQFEEA